MTKNDLLKWLGILVLGGLLLYFGAVLFVPMFFGLLLAFVIYPWCVRLEKSGISKYGSIAVCLFIVTVLFAGLIVLLTWQLQVFKADIPQILSKVGPEFSQFRHWLDQKFSLSMSLQDEWLHAALLNSGDKLGSLINNAFTMTAGFLFMLFLVPVYTALFLYHRGVFVKALTAFIGAQKESRLPGILQETVFTYANYIKGMVLVYLIVGTLNSVGLLALGIRHAVLFGVLTAFMTIIPYVGLIISSLLPISVAYITKDSLWYPIAVIGVFSFVQYLEANVIFPTVVGRQLNVSTWSTLVAIIVGGILWGVAGMILFIPFVAILKIITGHMPEYRALNLLLRRQD